MSSSPIVQKLILRAEATAFTHTPLPLFPDMGESTPHTAIVSCADPRVNPEAIFQLQPSDGVVIFRTIAGHPHTALNGILALDVAVRLDDILVLHHSDCGSTYWTEDQIQGALKQRCPTHEGDIGKMVFGATPNPLEENLKQDVAWLKSSPLMRSELSARVRGFMWDVQTGKLSEVA